MGNPPWIIDEKGPRPKGEGAGQAVAGVARARRDDGNLTWVLAGNTDGVGIWEVGILRWDVSGSERTGGIEAALGF